MDEMRILLFNFPQTMSSVRTGLLERPPFVVEEASRAADLLLRLESTTYALIIVNMPFEGIDIADVLPVIRSERMPCARSILILLTPEACLDERRPFLSKGVNALLSETASPEELDAAIARQTHVAPRVNARVMVRLKVKVQQPHLSLICQTLNLSRSGMLLSSATLLPIGSPITFELLLPGAVGALSGEAWVVRHTTVGREKQTGMGAAFIWLRHDGPGMLQDYIEQTLAKPDH